MGRKKKQTHNNNKKKPKNKTPKKAQKLWTELDKNNLMGEDRAVPKGIAVGPWEKPIQVTLPAAQVWEWK